MAPAPSTLAVQARVQGVGASLRLLLNLVWRASQEGTLDNLRRPLPVLLLLMALRLVFLRFGRPGRYPAPSMNGRKVIFLGPGCGHVAYQMGFVGGLMEDEELRGKLLAHGATFGGVSSGALVAAFAQGALRGVSDMRGWYTQYLRRGYEQVGLNSTMVMGAELERAGHLMFEACAREGGDGSPALKWLSRVVVLCTEVGTLRPVFLSDRTASPEQFGTTMKATAFVPGLMGPSPWVKLEDGRRVFDGYTACLRASWPDNYLVVSFLPTLPHILARNKHFLNVYPLDSSKSGLWAKSWPWGDVAWADAAFERGIRDAAVHIEELRDSVVAFLEDRVADTTPRSK